MILNHALITIKSAWKQEILSEAHNITRFASPFLVKSYSEGIGNIALPDFVGDFTSDNEAFMLGLADNHQCNI